MNDRAYVGLINAHTKSIGGYYNPGSPIDPSLLPCFAFKSCEARMVRGGVDTIFLQDLGGCVGFFTCVNVDNSRAWYVAQDV